MSEPLEVAMRLVRAETALVRRFDSTLSALHGVSFADLMVLVRLGEAPGGRMRRVDLAQALGLSASGVTRGLIPLERIGLVVREPDPRDARVAFAALTDTGRERLTDLLRTAEEVAADVFDGEAWDGGGLGRLDGLLSALGTGAERRADGGGRGDRRRAGAGGESAESGHG